MQFKWCKYGNINGSKLVVELLWWSSGSPLVVFLDDKIGQCILSYPYIFVHILQAKKDAFLRMCFENPAAQSLIFECLI